MKRKCAKCAANELQLKRRRVGAPLGTQLTYACGAVVRHPST